MSYVRTLICLCSLQVVKALPNLLSSLLGLVHLEVEVQRLVVVVVLVHLEEASSHPHRPHLVGWVVSHPQHHPPLLSQACGSHAADRPGRGPLQGHWQCALLG